MTTTPNTSTNTTDNVRHSARISIRKAKKAEKEKIERIEAAAAINNNKYQVKPKKEVPKNKLKTSIENQIDDVQPILDMKLQNDHPIPILTDKTLQNESSLKEINENSKIDEKNSTLSIKIPTEKSKTSKLNNLVNKMYTRIFDFTTNEEETNETEVQPSIKLSKHHDFDSEYDDDTENEYFCKLMHLNNTPSNAPNIHIYSTNKYDQVPFKVLQNTCIQCSKSFENSKWLRNHFVHEHFISKPTYTCSLCQNTEKEESYYELDDYLNHLLNKHDVFSSHSNFVQLYDLFLLKMSQDFIIDYYVTTNLKSMRNNSLISQLNLVIQSNFFNTEIISHEFVWKDLINNIKKVSKFNLIKEICIYLNRDESKLIGFKRENNDSEEYMQCSYCLKIFNKLNDFKLHLFNAHAYCNWINNYISCSYCRQLLKVFGFKENMIDLMNKHILNEQCGSIKSDSMPIYNPCGTAFIKKKTNLDESKHDQENYYKKQKLDDQSENINGHGVENIKNEYDDE